MLPDPWSGTSEVLPVVLKIRGLKSVTPHIPENYTRSLICHFSYPVRWNSMGICFDLYISKPFALLLRYAMKKITVQGVK
jgi:hypothetical protein